MMDFSLQIWPNNSSWVKWTFHMTSFSGILTSFYSPLMEFYPVFPLFFWVPLANNHSPHKLQTPLCHTHACMGACSNNISDIRHFCTWNTWSFSLSVMSFARGSWWNDIIPLVVFVFNEKHIFALQISFLPKLSIQICSYPSRDSLYYFGIWGPHTLCSQYTSGSWAVLLSVFYSWGTEAQRG